ncbi:energy transducer TonB [Nitrospirillum sp. BR 11828]|uniref:energy transducer TonB n=1 Tax=Nitrospirillum sp. BR 11828 TaxID=3104325 RepID=UPI002ACA8046|nr:energy transducer TonB [Nitrospirillum sp. BR 11828]MDZ5650333.1 energy transducer TonB [Nitrospirillum sp. BR 11828]
MAHPSSDNLAPRETAPYGPVDADPAGGNRRLVWGGSLAVVLAAHALALPWLMARSTQEVPPPPPAMQIDLPPPAPPPPEPPKPEPPKPEPPKPAPPKPTPPKPVAVKPIALPPTPAPPQPAEVATPQPEPPPSTAVQTAAPPAPPAPPVPPSKGPDTYEGRVMAQLYRFKRYPVQARQRHQTGTALLRFTIDRSGHVLAASLDRSAGAALLDEETLALVRRADPLPAMPDDRPGTTLELVVPVEFSLN